MLNQDWLSRSIWTITSKEHKAVDPDLLVSIDTETFYQTGLRGKAHLILVSTQVFGLAT